MSHNTKDAHVSVTPRSTNPRVGSDRFLRVRERERESRHCSATHDFWLRHYEVG